ncbi:MAG: hypothetical protein CMG66_06080 [Candidatus Marinimicrobia bacterium]|nr:hypothetical protein [Candidatus Neomarinimicrobiota bacterium]|tara:strand:- start:2219 stop:3013 length:795 start_codon:yes stop_codon:yes gene_type:complete
MKKTTLSDGYKVYCINRKEAQMLEEHIEGYFDDYITIKEGDTIIDIGANIGIFGLELSKKYKTIEIFAFEPIKNIYDVLKQNSILSQNKKFKTYNYGISDKNGEEQFQYFPNSPALSSSKNEIVQSKEQLLLALEGSLHHAPKKWWWANLIPKFIYPYIINNLIKNPINTTCSIKTLSNVIKENQISKINLLKIDCEGNELNVIKGIASKDWNIIKQIVIEVNDIHGRFEYISKKLINLGYNVKTTKDPSLKGTNLINLFAKIN